MSHSVLRSVLGQIDWWWVGLFRSRLEGLTDEELWWSPVERCWTLHPQDDGLVRGDYRWPPPKPAPFTTIAWRLCHIGSMLAGRTNLYFPTHAPELLTTGDNYDAKLFPTTAAGVLAYLDRWWSAWRSGLEAAGEAALWEPYGGVEGSYPEMQLEADDPFLNMVLHVHRELLHHGGEIGLLRDLYLAQQPRDPYVDAVLDGDANALAQLERDDPSITDRYRAERPDLPMRAAETNNPDGLRLLAERGFDLNALVDGHTALHHLAAHGNVALVENAVNLGADPTRRDETFGVDAAAWAKHFDNAEVLAWLTDRG